MTDRPAQLRALFEARNGAIIPGCHDAFGARLVEQAGFAAACISGVAVSGSLGSADGELSLDDMVQRTRELARSIDLPLMTDGDDGHGDASVIAHTVRRFEDAGAAGVHFDDQWLPRPAGAPKTLIAIEDMQAKIAAAGAARTSQNFTIIGRTDAMATSGFDEALRRARALEEAGADALLITYLTDRAEVERAVRALRKPLLVAVTETARKSFRADDLAGIELAAVIYPLSTLMMSLAAQRAVLVHLREARDTEAFIDRMMPMSQLRFLADARPDTGVVRPTGSSTLESSRDAHASECASGAS